jgi:hypothetical protein
MNSTIPSLGTKEIWTNETSKISEFIKRDIARIVQIKEKLEGSKKRHSFLNSSTESFIDMRPFERIKEIRDSKIGKEEHDTE